MAVVPPQSSASGEFDFGDHFNNYPYNVASNQNDSSAISLVCSIDIAELLCPNFTISPIITCAKENDIITEVEKDLHFQQLIFSRTDYEYEETVLKTSKLKEIPIHAIQRYRHRFTTIMQDEEFKRANKLKMFKKLFISNLVTAQGFIIERFQVDALTDENQAEYEVQISFLVQNEEMMIDACCDPPITKEFNLNNCDGDGIFAIPPDNCQDTTNIVSQTDNGDGTTTLSSAITGFGEKAEIFWFHNGEMVGSGTSFTTNQSGVFCARVLGDNCGSEECITIEDQCPAEIIVSSSGCNTIITVSNVGLHNGLILQNGAEIDAFFGGADNIYSFDLPSGDYTAVLEVMDCQDISIPFSVSECAEDCTNVYDTFIFSCSYDANTDSYTPTSNAGGNALIVDNLFVSINGGQDYSPYAGGGVASGNVALFRWDIQLEGCQQKSLYTACGKQCCPELVVPDYPEFPTEIGVNVLNAVQVEGDFCCDDETSGGGGGSSPCPDPITIAGHTEIVESRNDAFGVNGTYFATDPTDKIHFQTLGGVFVEGGGGTTINPACSWGASFPDATNCSRLNRVGIWVDDPAASVVTFGYCFNAAVSGYYSIGFGADNQGTISIDGVEILKLENNGGTPTEQQATFKKWYVVDIYLTGGQHMLRMDAENVDIGSPETIGFEIYKARTSQLQLLTTDEEIDAMVLAHSRMIDNVDLVFGVAGGLECPADTIAGYDGCLPICSCDPDYNDGVLRINVEQSGNLLMASLKNCSGVTSFEWFADLGDGDGFVSIGVGFNFSANQAGVYYAVGTCDLETIQSDNFIIGGGAWLL